MFKKLEILKKEMEEKTGHVCEIFKSADGHAIKCSGSTDGGNIFGSSSSSKSKLNIFHYSLLNKH